MFTDEHPNPTDIPDHYFFNGDDEGYPLYGPDSYFDPEFGLGWVEYVTVPEERHVAFKFLEDLIDDMYLQYYREPQCHHGLSLWLCEDPINHYPPDSPF